VTVDGETVISGGKLAMPLIRRRLVALKTERLVLLMGIAPPTQPVFAISLRLIL
jgi:hypothetical protein